MAIFKFFDFNHRDVIFPQEHLVYSLEGLEKVVNQYFHDRIVKISMRYWGSDIDDKTDYHAVWIKFINREYKPYSIKVGVIDQPFAEVEV